MIKLTNQLSLYFSIGDKKDFIQAKDLKSFVLYNSAGNLRPIVHITFTLQDKSIMNYLNAGNILTIGFGLEDSLKGISKYELFGDSTDCQDYGYDITIKGALYIPQFTSQVKSKTYKGTSLKVLQEIAKNAKLNFKTNVSNTDDSQLWYQSCETDWNFVFEPWLHSWINKDTFTVCGFDYENFYFYDIKKLINDEVTWIFDPTVPTDNKYVNYGVYLTKNYYGSLAPLVGKNLQTNVVNIDTGEISNSSYNLKNFTVVDSDKLNLNITSCQDYDYNFISGDNHKNYVTAYNQNIRNNTMYSSFCTYLSTAFGLCDIKLFDTAYIHTLHKDERLMGVHVVTGVTYQYENGVLKTNLKFNKEAPSALKGEYLTSNE